MHVSETDPTLSARCRGIDMLTALDLPGRGVIAGIHAAALAQAGEPLCLRAAKGLASGLGPGKIAAIATGWLDRPHVSRSIAESDGPPGAAVLARALHKGFGAIPFIFVEQEIVQGTVAVVQAAGLRCVSPQESLRAAGGSGAVHVASVIAMPNDRSKAEIQARDILRDFDVGAFIAIEKGGENTCGRIRTSRGADTTDALAKADALREACAESGIVTVGIGDGGNEIGMGLIRDRLIGHLRNSGGPDGSGDDGTVPAAPVDALVAAAVSNWGAYGVAAALALLLETPDVLHPVEMEEDILRASAAAGFIDGVSGHVAPSVDGLPLHVHLHVVRLLRTFVGEGRDTGIWSSLATVAEQSGLPA